MLHAHHISKSYQRRCVLNDVSLQIPPRGIIGLLGPNGAGKTTFFYTIMGLIRPNQGSLFLGDTEITHLPLYQRARLGISYLPQEASIFRHLSVRNNILSILELHYDSRRKRLSELARLMEIFQLQDFQNTKGISLSGGERRRVEIARALATAPRFLLLDEPFAGIDPLSITNIKAHIMTLHDLGIGLLITDHNVRETLNICHQASIFNQGRVIAHGCASELVRNEKVRQLYLGKDFSL
jgi:lipopolysaccharide export system ATP-binding protein